MRYPETWEVADEDKLSVTFRLGRDDLTIARFTVGPPLCKEGGGATEEEVINCLVLSARELGVKSSETFKLVSRETWEDEDWRGYVVEVNITWTMDNGESVTDYRSWMVVPLGPDTSLTTWLGIAGRDDVTQGVWRDFTKVIKSLRPLPRP